MLFTESEFRRLADVQPLDSLACSRHAELLPEVAQQFLEWAQKNKQSCVELLNSGDFADDKVGSWWPFCLTVAPPTPPQASRLWQGFLSPRLGVSLFSFFLMVAGLKQGTC